MYTAINKEAVREKAPQRAKQIAEVLARQKEESGRYNLRPNQKFRQNNDRRSNQERPTQEITAGSKELLPRVINKLDKETAKAIGDVNPPIGMTIQKTGKTPLEASKPKTYEFSDPEIEARWKESHGLKSPPLKDKAIELIQEGWRKLTRKFPALESGATHAKFKFALTKLEKQRDVQADKYLRVIQGLKNQLSKPDYSLFERKILLDDLTQEAKCSPHTRG